MAPNSTRPEPTETSPLLGQPEQSKQPTDPGVGLAPAGPESYDDTDVEEDGNEGDIERQASNGDSFKHQGLPEVRKRMKYIFPAIAIGVSKLYRLHSHTRLNIAGLSFCSRSDPYCLNLWNNRHGSQSSLLNILDSNRLLPHSNRIPTTLRQAQRHIRP